MTARRESRRVAGGAKRSRMHAGKPSWQDPEFPQQYQKGYVEFYKLKFKVTPDVLIPRPETELLVDAALDCIKYYVSSIKSKNILVLDVGTGSGNIAISIAKNISDLSGLMQPTCEVHIIATDISQKALKIAKQNAKLHGLLDKIKFIKSNLLSRLNYTLPPKEGRVNPKPLGNEVAASSAYTLIIVTNLPYIPAARIPYLESSVKDFEPLIALDGGEDGFELYRKLFAQLVKKGLNPTLLIGEIDYTHGELAALTAQKYFPDAEIEVKKDLAHMQRILTMTNKSDSSH